MAKQRDRIIIDTNLWISFLLTKDLSKLDSIIDTRKAVLIFSQELLDELIEVTQRKKFIKYFDPDDVANLLSMIRSRADLVEVESIVASCRDLKDNFLLSLALDARATHLITGDKDLLVLEKFGKTKILTIADYLSGS
jgi:putative PIN family toxin of toxin-antitoxin system